MPKTGRQRMLLLLLILFLVAVVKLCSYILDVVISRQDILERFGLKCCFHDLCVTGLKLAVWQLLITWKSETFIYFRLHNIIHSQSVTIDHSCIVGIHLCFVRSLFYCNWYSRSVIPVLIFCLPPQLVCFLREVLLENGMPLVATKCLLMSEDCSLHQKAVDILMQQTKVMTLLCFIIF